MLIKRKFVKPKNSFYFLTNLASCLADDSIRANNNKNVKQIIKKK